MQPTRSKPWLPYVVPMGIYMAFLLVQTNANLLWVYPAKTLAVAAANPRRIKKAFTPAPASFATSSVGFSSSTYPGSSIP